MKCPRFTVVCGEDGESKKMIGEASAQGVSLFGSTITLADGQPLSKLFRESSSHEKLDSLLVRNADESASRLETIFSGEEQALDRETLLINAAVASWTHGSAGSLEKGLEQGAEALDSGKALNQLRKWQKFSEQ
jgi:anthranilate phosphoribosyltransferase